MHDRMRHPRPIEPREDDGVKVFSATMFADRDQLGDKVTRWIAEHPSFQVTEMVVTQLSDASFHCVAITVFYREPTRSGV